MTGGDLVALATAAAANGWMLGAIVEVPSTSETMIGGYVAFERERSPWEDRKWGTAAWTVENELGAFHSGHYDLTRDDALADLGKRTA